MFSLKENGEFEIITNLNGGTEPDAINPLLVTYEDNNDILKVDTKGMILVDGKPVDLDQYYTEATKPEDLKSLPENVTTDENIDDVLDAIVQNGFEAVLKAVGPKVLVSLLVAAGHMGVKTPNGFVVPETIAQKAARLERESAKIPPPPRGRRTMRSAALTDDEDEDMEGGASYEQRLIALNRVISYFRGAGAKFLNREKIDTTADSLTGVKYNALKEKVDYEALQHQINESHLRFKLSIQGLFGSIGYNPKITVGVDMAGGYSVTNDQLKGGMLPALVPISIVSKVPSFSADIASKINQAIALLKNKGKALTTGSKEQIDVVINKVKDEEKQLMKLATSLENIAKDPNAPADITQETVEKYSDKLKSHQVKSIDIAKALGDILASLQAKEEADAPVTLTTDVRGAEKVAVEEEE